MRRLRGSLIALVILVATLVMVPGPASASHITPPPGGPASFVKMNPLNPTCNLSNPGVIEFPVATPFAIFPGRYCKHAQVPGPPQVFALELATGGFLGLPDPIVLSGDVVCFTVINHDAWERGLITASNSGFFVGSTIFSRLQDNNSIAAGGNQVAPLPAPDAATLFLTPPGSTSCPPIPITVSPVTSGSVVVHQQ